MKWAHRLFQKSRRIGCLLESLDPRVVRLTDPTKRPHHVFSMALLGSILAVAIIILTSTIKNAFAKSGAQRPATAKKPVKQVITYSTIPLPPAPFVEKQSNEIEVADKAPTQRLLQKDKVPNPSRHPRFFDPILLFTEVTPQNASAYPMASPPGIVVDVQGVPEPIEPVSSAVGGDDRIRSIKRRTTGQGIRYIIQLSTPLKRITLETEGRVVMVYPIS